MTLCRERKNRTTIFSATRTTNSSREESPVASRVNQVRECPVAKEINAQSPVANTLIPPADKAKRYKLIT